LGSNIFGAAVVSIQLATDGGVPFKLANDHRDGHAQARARASTTSTCW